MMIRTVQAQEQYKALERDLINNLQTEQLQSIQQECVQTAYSLRSEEFKRRFGLGAICIVAALAAKVTSWPMEIAAFLASIIMCIRLAMAPEGGYGLVFSLPSGESFSLHQWTGMPDDPSRLRFWQEARDGHHGVFEVAAVRLTNADHRAFLLRNSGIGGMLFQWLVLLIAAVVFCLFIAFLGVQKLPVALPIFGSILCLPFILNKYFGALQMGEQFDPNKRCHGNAYQAIVQTLEVRGVARPARRIR
ncbi:MAG: hypothetical protein ABL974_06630 [Prosthecobacter sp.]